MPLVGVFAGTLLAALAPREAKAVTFFSETTSVSFPSPQPCLNTETGTGEGCYTNWLVLSDIDNDGDLDVLFANGGGYYAVGAAESSVVYLNDGNAAFRDATPNVFGGATSRLRQVSIGDIDGDGDLDIYQPGGYGVDLDKLWVQTSQGVFQNQAATRLPGAPMSRAGSSHFADLDGDGDLDLIVGDWGNASTSGISRLALYANDGTGVFKRIASQVEPVLATDHEVLPTTIPTAQATAGQPPVYAGRRPIDLDVADVDGDFDLDILINHRDGQSRIFLNDGQAQFTDGTNWASTPNGDGTYTITANYPPKKGPYAYNQELCDVDGDGDLDLLVDNAGNKTTEGNFTQISLNDGTGKFIDQTATKILGEPGSDDNAVKCVDVNNDGKYDLVVASLQSSSEKLLLNDGTGIFNYVPDAFPIGKDPTLGIDIADLNGDGVFDVVTGQGEGNPRLNRIFKGMGASQRDTRPPKFRAIQQPKAEPDKPTAFLLAITDSVTSETGEHVKEVSVNYSSTAKSGKVKAKFVGGDLFRVVIPAVPNGTKLTLIPSATDRIGNIANATPIVMMVGTPSTGTGGTGGGGGSSVGGATSIGGSSGTAGIGGVSNGGAGGGAGTAGSAGTAGATASSGGTTSGGTGGDEGGWAGSFAFGGAGGDYGLEGGFGGLEGEGGTPGGEPSGTGGTSSSGGKSSSSGGKSSSSEGGTLAQAGEESAGGAPPSKPETKDDDDGGCSVAAPGTSTANGLIGALLLGAAAFFRRRRRD